MFTPGTTLELRLDTPTFRRLYLEMLDVRKGWMRFMNSSKPVELEEQEKVEPTSVDVSPGPRQDHQQSQEARHRQSAASVSSKTLRSGFAGRAPSLQVSDP